MGAEQSTNRPSGQPAAMGSTSNTTQHSGNDFELVIKISRELETFLEKEFGATGRGLHEKIGSVQSELTPQLIKRMRYLATIRNKLIHQASGNGLPDRAAFIRTYDLSKSELRTIVERRRQTQEVSAPKYQQQGRRAVNIDPCAFL